MNEKISCQTFSALSETLLLPLWAKAVEYAHPEPLLRDAAAKRMVDEIDYDFAKFKGAVMSQVGCCTRAALIDGQVREFIGRYPKGVIVQLGAGLDARFERLGQPEITAWYDLDLPEVMALRRRLLPESGNFYLAQSLFDEAWIERVQAHGQPVCVVLEGVLMYFDEVKVKQIFAMLHGAFTQAWVVLDLLPPYAVGKAKQHDGLRHISNQPEYLWTLAKPADLSLWYEDLKVRAVLPLSESSGKRFPLLLRCLYQTPWGKNHLDQKVVTVEWGK